MAFDRRVQYGQSVQELTYAAASNRPKAAARGRNLEAGPFAGDFGPVSKATSADHSVREVFAASAKAGAEQRVVAVFVGLSGYNLSQGVFAEYRIGWLVAMIDVVATCLIAAGLGLISWPHCVVLGPQTRLT